MKKFTFQNSRFLIFLTLFVLLIGSVIIFVSDSSVLQKGKRNPYLLPDEMPEIRGLSTPPPPPDLSPTVEAMKKMKAGKFETGHNYMGAEYEEEELLDFGFVEGGVEGGIESGVIGGLKGNEVYPIIVESMDGSACAVRGSGFNTEEYNRIKENEFKDARQNPLSTFSIDVDNASYSNVRRFVQNNRMPPKDAVRIEELVNYFTYDYPQPEGEHPFSINYEISRCPWNDKHKLAHIGLQGKSLDYDDLKPCNLVFLIDTSGSMAMPNKLPLLKKSLGLLLNELDDKDKIAIVVYAGSAGLALPATPASQKTPILHAIEQLEAGGSTAGGEGIELAYKIAKENLIEGGNNRVILSTDGDFNVGVSSSGDLVRLIEEKRKDDIYLTICGFGMGNYKDGRMEEISNAGNGNYFYIDNIREAEKVFVKEMRANLFTIAKDVKIQVEFNPIKVKAYRLIGYENRILAKEDFDDDKKDAGELGPGHTVTALYEIIPAGSVEETRKTAVLKYQETKIKPGAADGNELLTVNFRYKPPKEEKSKLIVTPILDEEVAPGKTSDNFRFSAAVAQFGMMLRGSKHAGNSTFAKVLKLAKPAVGKDPSGYRGEFLNLVESCRLLTGVRLAYLAGQLILY